MTSKEFAIWLRGFTVACHEYAPTPKQWDILKETLSSVSDVNGEWINQMDQYNSSNMKTTQPKLQEKFPF